MSTKQLKHERMMNPEKSSRARDTAKRLCRQLKGQRVRLGIVGISIIIYIGLSIWNPMYSAIVIDHLWQSIQAQKSLAMKSPMNFDEDWHQRRNTLNQTRQNRSKTQNVHAKYSVRKLRKSIRTKSA